MKDRSLQVTRRNMLLGSSMIAGAWTLPAIAVESEKIQAKIDASQKRPPISPLIYGGFLEHIGNLINHSMWSEVLDDRKFYYGVIEKAEPMPTDWRAMMSYIYKWVAIGPMSAIRLNNDDAYVGEHSPEVEVDAVEARGMSQSGLALVKGKSYVGRIVVAADRGVRLTATLIWGEGENDRQSVRISASRDWKTKPLHFTCGADTTTARLEIVGTGKGSFRVGAISLMPSDNIKGFRADTIKCMQDMQCKILRMPGGNFVSAYDWKYTIGDPDKRPPILDPVWKAVQPNDVGVDELLQMCEIIGCVPYWCVDTGFGEPRSGAELVEYVNGAANTPWGAKRAANGHKKPYAVKYWNIGNEMYGHWQYGHMSRDQYDVKHNLFADQMRAVDPSIYIVAPGGFVDEMTTGQGIIIEGQPQVKVGSDRDWAYGMFKNCWGKFDALATHAYPPENMRYDLETGKKYEVKQTLLEWARQPPDRVRTMVDAWEDYKKLFPKLNDGEVKVFFDEWAYHFKDDLKGALAVALTFHEFFRHTDFIGMAGYTMATAWMDFNRTQSTISTRGRLFQLYEKHFGSIPVAVDGNSPQPAPKYPIGGDQPRVNSGSPTYPLDLSAALSEDGKTLIVAVVNVTEKSQSLNLALQGFATAARGHCWKFTGKSVDARDALGIDPEVVVVESDFDTTATALSIAPISVEIYHYPAV